MTDNFSKYHPLTNFIFFLTVTLITVFSMHPAVLCVSLAGAFIYGIVLDGVRKTMGRAVCFAFPVALLTAVINPMFNHYGVTVLFFLPGGNPVTLESTVYGLMSGLRMASVIMWFICISKIMTADKYICLIGGIAPHTALLISMIMRFVPLFDRRRKKIKSARQCIGCGRHEDIRSFSCLMTWALENNKYVADSMVSRGYGSGRRTFFCRYIIRKKDVIAIIYMVATVTVFIGGLTQGVFASVYDPVIKVSFSVEMIPFASVFALFVLCPVFADLGDRT